MAAFPWRNIAVSSGFVTHAEDNPRSFRIDHRPALCNSRAVLSRGGKAERLTYDHKAEDTSERERVEAAGGFVMRNRVLGILAVSRSFGNQGMKEFVTSSPHVSVTRCGECEMIRLWNLVWY